MILKIKNSNSLNKKLQLNNDLKSAKHFKKELEKNEKIGSEKYFILSDQAAIFETPLNCFVYDLQGNLIFKALDTLKIKPGFQQEICLDCQSDSIQKINYILIIIGSGLNFNINASAI